MKIALLEGRPLFREEQWQMEDDLRAEMWQPIDPPSILNDFDEWFDWCAYRHTRDHRHVERHLHLLR